MFNGKFYGKPEILKNIIMTIREQFENLKELDINAKSDAERAKISRELEQKFVHKCEEEMMKIMS